MAKSYSDLWKEAEDLEKEGENVANFNESVAKLPYTLKDEFRKAQDPALDKAINKAQSDTFGAAIKGLNMYQGISDPFARRDLAESYQGIVEQGWKNLTDERTRRQGVYADYITKWTGLFGAEAAKKQDLFNNKMTIWEKEKSLADTEESNRRWEIENARAERTAGSKVEKDYTNQEITATVAALKAQGKNWGEINDFLVSEGIDTVRNSYADKQMRSIIGGETIEEPLSYSEQNAKMKYEEAKSQGNGTKENPYKTSKDADYGDYYWSGTKKKKKVNWAFDPTIND